MKNIVTQALVVAGLSGGSGKSVAAIGLVAALRDQGQQVITFKKGPDYIDAGWLATASGRPCYNLDPYLMCSEVLTRSFNSHGAGFDCAVVEGNRGLYDGVNAAGGYSTAELALQLDLPVLLVVNCSKTTRTVAAMVLGCRELDKRVRLAGVILNQIATARHERVIIQAVEQYTGIPVVGIVPRMQDIFPMRHLGVVPHQEYGGADAAVARLGSMAAKHFDLPRILALAAEKSLLPAGEKASLSVKKRLTIGVIRDAAFQFYYEDNLEALRQGGAELVMINALTADSLPDTIDALYIGGGFPETSASALAENISFRRSVKARAEQGLPIYAECGGLIFLGRAIVLDGKTYPLADVFPVIYGLDIKPQAHGYSTLSVEHDNPFYEKGSVIKGHEFRYSTVDEWEGKVDDLVFTVERGTGFVEKRDGLLFKNVLALYTHVIAGGTPAWARGLLRTAAAHRQVRLCSSS